MNLNDNITFITPLNIEGITYHFWRNVYLFICLSVCHLSLSLFLFLNVSVSLIFPLSLSLFYKNW